MTSPFRSLKASDIPRKNRPMRSFLSLMSAFAATARLGASCHSCGGFGVGDIRAPRATLMLLAKRRKRSMTHFPRSEAIGAV